MALSRQDVLLGRALIAWNLVDRGRLRECADEVARWAAQGRQVTLGQVLVHRRLLSPERYQAIVARLRQVYLDSTAPPQVQRAVEQMPPMSASGRYTDSPAQPRLDESHVDRAVQVWQQVAPQVTAPGNDIEFDFSAAAPPAPPLTARHAAPAPAPEPAPSPAATRPSGAPNPERARPDLAIRKRLKVPPGQDRFPVGNWVVEQYLADGAWGVVYRVTRQGGDAAPFALKVLKHLEPSPEIRQRFIGEARTMAKLSHPNIVHVHDAGVASGLLWFVMDFQPGADLKKVLEERGPLPLAEGLRVMERLCDAVAYAHERKVFHRDLKPENVIMAGTEPILTDFGLAKDSQSGMNLTMEGQRIGTPLYMAPELLLEAEAATPQTEVYALGAMTYQVLTGRVPFEAKRLSDLADLIEKGRMTPLRELCKEASKPLEKLCARALHKDPARRPQSVAELRAELARLMA